MINPLSIKNEDYVFGKNMILIAIFFLITPITLGISLFSLFSLKTSALAVSPTNPINKISSPFSGVQVYASLPAKLPAVSGEVGVGDARVEIVRQYLKSYDSPLTPYTEEVIRVSDKYGLDYRLLPAIAQQESNLCKVIPPGSYNCWGWGIHSAGSLGFDSYNEGLDTVAKGLKTNYIDKGYVTVNEIMSKYNPISPDGAWGKGVESFMSDME
jgi:hypothetical protein